MKTITGGFCTALTFYFAIFCSWAFANADIRILKNSGGTNLIENTLVATTVSVSQGADYLALPINMSADDQLVVFKDTTLNRLTDVAEVFPTQYRNDGNYYVVDFSLGELRQLRLRNVFEDDSNSLSLGIPTLKEELTLIRSLNALLDKNTGVVLTLQEPAFYNKEGKSLSMALQQTLQVISYTPTDKLFIECADPDELQKISRWSQTENGEKFSLIQQINPKQTSEPEPLEQRPITYQHDWLFTNSGLRILASYASAVSLPAELLKPNSTTGNNLVSSLRNYGIKIFLQSEKNNEKTTFPDSRLSSTHPDSFVKTEADFDGIYLDSLDVASVQGTRENPVSGSIINPQPQTEQSTLPPFFSNLGLSQPNNANHSTDNEETEETEDEFPESFE